MNNLTNDEINAINDLIKKLINDDKMTDLPLGERASLLKFSEDFGGIIDPNKFDVD